MDNCPFCNWAILRGRILYVDADWYVLESIKPISKPHYLIIPKRHIRTFREVRVNEMNSYYECVQWVYHHTGVDLFSYINGTESQEVLHLHVHMFKNFLKPLQLHGELERILDQNKNAS